MSKYLNPAAKVQKNFHLRKFCQLYFAFFRFFTLSGIIICVFTKNLVILRPNYHFDT